ncbi:uncharacterized protein EDB91DRAFT_1076368 [Suillus paluster]|uniref:uncharacterized protein n=1 Tax=Suillus paluster TaxID=48578 RepID=UPI001B870050|nr:uncharacterized protein EDB91DRAFT_1076368 [Suillus paluster]KAG1756307.1 hypothetical protein EDB91DRAFT_1076368 [Suillus paluster]
MISLTLSSESVRHTVITNEQDTPFRLGVRTTTIHKIKPNDDNSRMQDQFEIMGEIEWHTFASSKFRFGGTEVETKNFIPNRGWMGRKRVFIGPDGRSYRWDLQDKVVVLFLDDGSQTEVARYHRATLGIIGKKRKATLEVSPAVAHMMDTVIMTFIYVEKLRMDDEQATRNINAAASGAGAPFIMISTSGDLTDTPDRSILGTTVMTTTACRQQRP